ncbi:MAG TPA: glycosyltransferase [Thermoanaerobaculia bacterium]|nr:glycosyltransferase [Thermoanaerobaculia bacterium]
MSRRLSVGFVSPFPPVRSGIADFSAELLEALRPLVDAVPYGPGEAAAAPSGGHDVLLAHIGNDPVHAGTYEMLTDPARRTPAVVTLHDYSIHHLFAAAYLDTGRHEQYGRELVRNHGEKGRRLWERMRGGARIPVWDLEPWNYPMSTEVIRRAEILVAHSRLVAGSALRAVPGTDAVELPLHVVPALRTPRDEARRALDLPLDRPIAVTLGLLTPAKRVRKVLEALGSLAPGRRPFLFVGGTVRDDDPLCAAVRGLGLEEDVAFGGWLSEEDFWRAASAADLAVNLRHPTVGESSGAVCRLAGFGLPLIVSDAGWFRELPDAFATKVPVGEGEVEALAAELSDLAFDPARARRRGEAAAAWGARRRPGKVAAAYELLLREAAEGRGRPRALTARLGAELSALGVGRPGALRSTSREPDAALLAEASARLAGLLPARPVPSFD